MFPFNGVRPVPEAITKYCVVDRKTEQFLSGYFGYANPRFPGQIATWTTVPRLRRQFDSFEEASIEMGMMIDLGMNKGRLLEVATVHIL